MDLGASDAAEFITHFGNTNREHEVKYEFEVDAAATVQSNQNGFGISRYSNAWLVMISYLRVVVFVWLALRGLDG